MKQDAIATAGSIFRRMSIPTDRPWMPPGAADFHSTIPLDNRLNRTTYVERCWPNNESINGYDYFHLLQDGEQVFVTYEGHAGDGRVFRNSEILAVRKNRSSTWSSYLGWAVSHKAAPGDSIAM